VGALVTILGVCSCRPISAEAASATPKPRGKESLAACRTGGDFYVPRILLRIERVSLLKIIATIADGRRSRPSGSLTSRG
jgi:hypothetical protein